MAASRLKEIKSAFFNLREKEQAVLIGEIYKFSKETRFFLENRLLGVNTEVYVNELEKLTYERFGNIPPKWVEARKVNAVISRAKKAKISDFELFILHFYVFEAYVVWIDMYGMSDEAVEDKCVMHLDKALGLLDTLAELNESEKEAYREKALSIVNAHDNMYQDGLLDMLL